MSTAVGVLILDEPEDLSATVRATLEHMPEFHTIGEADLDRADAFVARSKSPRELGAALLALAEGSDVLVPSEQPVAMPPEAGESLGLTPREAEVLRFLSSGFSNKEVARRLALSVRTVETHRLNLRRKTQTGRLKDLVSLARQLGLAPVVDSGDQVRRGTDSRSSGNDNQSRH